MSAGVFAACTLVVAIAWFIIGSAILNYQASKHYMGSAGVGVWIVAVCAPAILLLIVAAAAGLVALAGVLS